MPITVRVPFMPIENLNYVVTKAVQKVPILLFVNPEYS